MEFRSDSNGSSNIYIELLKTPPSSQRQEVEGQGLVTVKFFALFFLSPFRICGNMTARACPLETAAVMQAQMKDLVSPDVKVKVRTDLAARISGLC